MGQLYLVLTDGTTTITIADGAGTRGDYRLREGSWAPAIAGRRDSPFDGPGPYREVTEEFVLDIYGTSAIDAYAKLQTLNSLLAQAEPFMRGETTAPVLIKFSPEDASVSSITYPLQAVVLQADRPGLGLTLKPSFHDLTGLFAIEGVKVKLQRQGEWKGRTWVSSGLEHSHWPNGDIETLYLEDTPKYLSPTKIEITNMQSYANVTDPLIIVAGNAKKIVIVPAESMATVGYTSVDDSARFARNTYVLRYTPTSTTELPAVPVAVDLNITDRQFLILASIRNNSATTDFRIRCQLGGANSNAFTPISKILANTITPQWYMLGIVSLLERGTTLTLYTTASAVSGTLDIDSFVIVSVDSPDTFILPCLNPTDYLGGRGILTIDHRLLTHNVPLVLTSAYAIGYLGNLWVPTIEALLYALILQCGSNANADRWRVTYTSGAEAVDENLVTLTRTNAYLTPE